MKNYVQAMVADIAPKMQLPIAVATVIPERVPGKKFVVQEPLKNEVQVAFVSKRHMGKAAEAPTVLASVVNSTDKGNAPETVIVQKVQVVQKPKAVADAIDPEKVAQQYIDPTNARVATVVSPLVPKLGIPNVVNLNKSISKVSNLIKDYLHMNDAFNQVKSGIKDKKMYAETFYVKVQNCIYHSLRTFCGLTKDEKNIDILPVVSPNMPAYATLLFFDRIFNDRSVSFEKTPNKVMGKYRSIFNDADGIEEGWKEAFKARIKMKLPMEDGAIDQLAEIILKEWGQRFKVIEHTASSTPTRVGDAEAPAMEIPLSPGVAQSLKETIERAQELQCPDELEEPNEDEDAYLNVSIIHDEDIDIIKIESSDGYGKIAIPFYTKLDTIRNHEDIPSIADDRNGNWDWLIHFVPDLMFKTSDPEKYLAGNDEEDKIKCVIMDENNGDYVVGVYCLESIVLHDETNPEADDVEDYSDDTITLINKLVNMEVASGFMSHLNRSLNNPEFFREEEYILKHVMNVDISNSDAEESASEVPALAAEVLVEASREMDDAAKAALAVMMGGNVPEQQEAVDQEEQEEENEEEPQMMDPTVVSVGNEEEDFTFQPIQKARKLQD